LIFSVEQFWPEEGVAMMQAQLGFSKVLDPFTFQLNQSTNKESYDCSDLKVY
jgi:hypothetical protein